MRICPALGSARKSPSFSPIRSSQVCGRGGRFILRLRGAELGHHPVHLDHLVAIFFMHFPPGFDALFFEDLAMGGEALGGGRFRLVPVHKARASRAGTGRTECRFDQRPVQRRFGLRGNGRDAGTGPLRPWFRARPALGSAGRRDQRLEGFRRFGGRAEAIVRADREQTVDDRDQAVGEARPDVRDRDVTLPDPLDEPILPGHAGEGIGPREQAVHRAAETEEVRPGIDRLYP